MAWATVLAGLGAAGGPEAVAGAAGRPAAARSSDYVDPTRVAVGEAERSPVAAARAALRRIADQPSALWPVIGGSDVTGQVDGYVSRALAAGRGPLIVLYGIPDRDCGGASGGGSADADAYRRYVADVVAGLAGRYATVVVEPDAVPLALTGCHGVVPRERYALIAGAVVALRAGGPVRLYLDAGNEGFVPDVDRLAGALRSAGIDAADGFSLNVANFYGTDDEIAYGTRLSAAVGDKHFVIDTSRNGAGPLVPSMDGGRDADGVPVWCNPPGRALGPPPTDRPGPPLVDALLWIKNPGESDGTCRPGEPGAGAWYPAYALELAGQGVTG